MGEGEKYNFIVHGDIKEKVLIINITPTHAADHQSPHAPCATCLHTMWTNYSHQLALHADNENYVYISNMHIIYNTYIKAF